VQQQNELAIGGPRGSSVEGELPDRYFEPLELH
jgi:hypothetical protein